MTSPPPPPPPPPPSIAIILCSTRTPRICPQIAAFVTSTISTLTPSLTTPTSPPHPPYTLHTLDLLAHPLPFFDEPLLPSQITHPSSYTHSHTRAWSQEVSRHAAYVFVTPQYNWGYPAVVKNAIDFLYHEWRGKAGMIVSYGGHGGGRAAGQLREVLGGVRMRVAETMPALTFPSKDAMLLASKGEELPLSGEEAIWRDERAVIGKAFEELLALVAEG